MITAGKVPCPLVGSIGSGGKPPSYAVGRVHATGKNSLETRFCWGLVMQPLLGGAPSGVPSQLEGGHGHEGGARRAQQWRRIRVGACGRAH
eukprot:1180247-Prorocentrum_minimum.AAC.3